MKILFDLVHPADALFFHHAIGLLRAQGADILIVSRDKDVLVPLLDALGHSHEIATVAGKGTAGLALELLRRDWAIWRLAREFRPDVMAGFGGVAISHAGKLTGIPSVSFYDTEHAPLQIQLALPFISEWHVPRNWGGPEARGRSFRFDGGKQSAYLHPDYFRPSLDIALAAGLNPDRDNFLVRTVAWQANHDAGRVGIGPTQLRAILATLAERGEVHISAEGALPGDLEAMRYRGDAAAFHHLLAHCRCYVGESITVASEATMLGVPALVQIDKEYGYVAEQERAGILHRFDHRSDFEATLGRVLAEAQDDFRLRARAYAATMGDINAYVAQQLERVGRRSLR